MIVEFPSKLSGTTALIEVVDVLERVKTLPGLDVMCAQYEEVEAAVAEMMPGYRSLPPGARMRMMDHLLVGLVEGLPVHM